MNHYIHQQTSTKAMLLFAPIATVIIGAWLSMQGGPPRWVLIGVLFLVALVIAIFSTLTVEVTDRDIIFGFGLGIMRRRVPLADIARTERITLPWWYGTGVKLGLKTTTYLVCPGPAVSLTLLNGKSIRIGTDGADALRAALGKPR